MSIAAPAELDNLIARLLEKEPEHRPQTAAEVARELTTFRAMVSVVEHSPQKRLDAVNTKTTEPELRAGVRGMGQRSWPFVLCGAVLLALFLWNRSLSRRATAFIRSEAAWREAYHSESRDVWIVAARALREIGAAAPSAVKVLIQGLDDCDVKVRSETVKALGSASAVAKSAVPFLAKVRNTDENPEVRHAAAEAIETISSSTTASPFWPWVLATLLSVSVIGGLVVRRKLPSNDRS